MNQPGWLASIPVRAIPVIVGLILAVTVTVCYLVAKTLIDRSEPGPQRGLVKAPRPPWSSPGAAPPAQSLFTPFDSTDEFRAVRPPRVPDGRRPVNGARHRAGDGMHRQWQAVPWAAAPPPRDGEAAGG